MTRAVAIKVAMAPKPSHNLCLDGFFSTWNFPSEAMQLSDSSFPCIIMDVDEVEVFY